MLEKSVSLKEPRFMMRVLRVIPSTRRKLNANVVRRLVNGFYTHSATDRDALLAFVDEVQL
jgi:26S proteasome regulatory subunit N3